MRMVSVAVGILLATVAHAQPSERAYKSVARGESLPIKSREP
ncbi:MAG: hypothetical protein AVDCRST_MAG04-1834 [uncultured Acetobacteraceae bacterium]|uniref:Uncharacterized protein n=1 Tax=uncultured Acetobacteraceae bacterium TaxID=169975 RepID=A0A6J4I8Q1_9PROT|nr:MAG: hypothetical protein AVDCRST_MAG04-1834 [uncultured Acetobacteraceae bacterium]